MNVAESLKLPSVNYVLPNPLYCNDPMIVHHFVKNNKLYFSCVRESVNLWWFIWVPGGHIGVDYSYIFNCHSVLGLCAKGQVKVSHILSLLIQVSKQAVAMVTGWHVECSPHNWHVIQSFLSCIAILLQSSALEMEGWQASAVVIVLSVSAALWSGLYQLDQRHLNRYSSSLPGHCASDWLTLGRQLNSSYCILPIHQFEHAGRHLVNRLSPFLSWHTWWSTSSVLAMCNMLDISPSACWDAWSPCHRG